MIRYKRFNDGGSLNGKFIRQLPIQFSVLLEILVDPEIATFNPRIVSRLCI